MRLTTFKAMAAAVWTVLAVAAGTGCGGCLNPPDQCDQAVVDLGDYADETTLSMSDDQDPGTLGIQKDLIATATDNCGHEVAATSGKLEFSKTGEGDWEGARNAQLDSGKAVFRLVSFPAGKRFVRVTMETERLGSVSRTISVNGFDPSVRPEVASFQIAQDLNGDLFLNSVELKDGEAPIAALELGNVEDGRQVEVRDEFTHDLYGSAVVAGAAAAVTLDGLPDFGAGDYHLVAHVTNSSGLENKTADGSDADPINTAAFAELRIDREAPAITLLAPTETVLGPSKDADPATEGFQLDVSATVSPDASPEVAVELTGIDVVKTTHSNGSILQRVTLPASGTTEYTLTVRAQDAAGNEISATHTFTVDYDPPVIDLTSPLAANGPYDTFALTASATVTGADGQKVHLFTRPAGSALKNPLADLDVVSGSASADLTFPGGTIDVIAEVSDEAGNLATDTELNVPVLGKGCSVLVTTPAGNPAILMGSNDTDSSTAGLQFAVTGSSSNCANAPVEVYLGGSTTPVAGTTDASGNYAIPVNLAEGQSSVKVQMTDQYGATNFVEVAVTVDLTPPSITQPANNASLGTNLDLQELQPGAQQALTFAPVPVSGTRIDVCINAAIGPSPTACPDGATGWFRIATNVVSTTTGFTFPDGVYQLKLLEVVDPSGSSYNVSAPISLRVDTIRPSVSGFTFMGDLNGDDRLNLAESPSGTPSAQIVISEFPATVSIQDANTGVVIGGPRSFTGTTGAVPINTGTATEQDYNLVAVVTDAIGNRNVIANPTPANPLNTAAFKTFRLDRVKPTVTVQSPSKSLLGTADDGDAATAGFQFRIAAVTGLDVGANGLALTMTNATVPSSLTPNSAGTATTMVTLPSTGTTNHTLTLTPTDTSGNVGAPVSMTVTVDRDAPAIVLTAPTAAGGPYGTYSLQTTASVTGAEGQPVRVFTTVSGSSEVELQSLPAVSSGSTTAAITYPNGTQTIRLQVADAAGNLASVSEPNVVVNGVGCSLLISSPAGSPAMLNRSNDQNTATTTTWEGVLTGSTSNCAGQAATLYRGSGAGRTLLAGPVNADASGNFSFNFSLGQGSFTLEVELNNGAGVLTQAQRDVVVDLTPPTLSNVSPSGSTLYFVAASNSHLVPVAQAGYVADGTPGGDANFNVGLTATDAVGGTAVVTYAGNTVGGPVAISTTPQTLSIPVVLPQNSTGSLVVKVTDSGGNQVSQTSAATVDVVAPDAPVVAQSVVSGQERAAKVSLIWSPVYDDGSSSASGATQGYDLRWTTNAVTETGIASESDYLSSTLVKKEPIVAWSSGPITHILDVPPFAKYWIAVRAVDEVGNYSAFAAPTPLDNLLTLSALNNPGAALSQNFALSMAGSMSIDGDSIADLVVGAYRDGAGSVYVYNGGANFLTRTPQKIVPPASPPTPNNDNTAQSFGIELAAGKTSDTTGDILVGSPTWSRTSATPAYATNTGRAFLYFGGTSPIDTTTYVEFRGNSGSELGRAARIIGDINGDSYDEIVLTASAEASGQGKVYIFFGRPKGDATTIGSWLYLQSQGGGFVSMSSANVVVEGPSPVASGGNQFGRQPNGVAYLGNIDGAGPGEFLIPDSQDTINKVFAFAGQSQLLTAAQRLLKTGTLPTPNDALQTITQGPSGSGLRFGFGSCVRGGLDLTGGAATDLLITTSRLNKAYVFPDASASGYGTTPITITGPSGDFFGYSCEVADINGDGTADIAIGENVANNGSVWIFYRKSTSPDFDTQAGTGFAQSRLKGVATNSVAFAVNDFTGDGKVDIAAGDVTDGFGKVNVWH